MVRGGVRGNLGQVGYADHLIPLSKTLEHMPYLIGNRAADPRVDLIEDQGLSRHICCGQRLEG